MPDSIQALCAQGQAHLVDTDYLAAERVLVQAEAIAWEQQDWDALARLYMPLQEARRQRRQRALDGAFFHTVWLDPAQLPTLNPQTKHGEFIVAGESTIAPAIALRKMATESARYADFFLAAAYQVGEEHVVLIVPNDVIAVPASVNSIDTLLRRAPPHSVTIPYKDLPANADAGDETSGAFTMELWERLHRPFLAAADSISDPIRRMQAYRETIAVDYGCELAHQKLAATAQEFARHARQSASGIF